MTSGAQTLSRTFRISLLLGGLKLATAVLSGSQAVMASALDSLSDSFISWMNLRFFRMAEDPPDAEHPFGHGKIEGLASLFQAALLTGIVLVVAGRAIHTLVLQVPAVPAAGPALAVMLASTVVSAWLARSLSVAAAATDSLVLRSDAAHYRMDVAAGAGVALGLFGSWLSGWWYADPLVSLLMAIWMAKDVVSLWREAADELMDRALSAEELSAVDQVLARADPRIRSWHELRTRRSGQLRFVQAHLVFDGDISLADAHAAAEEVEAELRQALPRCHVLLHLDVSNELSSFPGGEGGSRQPP